MDRRQFLQFSAVSSLLWLAGCGGSGGNENNSGNITPPVSDPPPTGGSTGPLTGNALAIPPLLAPAAVNGIRTYELTLAESEHQFFAQGTSRTYGINGSYLGPTLRMKRGDRVRIQVQNNLPEATTLHGHGMHVPAIMDGGPHQLIDAGGQWLAEYDVNQPACTNWYHPHRMGVTAEQVYFGLAGFILIDDDDSLALPLPSDYGVDDIPLVIQDRVFDSNGQLVYSPSNMQIMQGYRGDTFLTNGQIEPVFSARTGILRLRLLNGSNAGLYRFRFNDGREFHQIAGDNSLLPAPISLTSLTLSPGERAEILVDLGNDGGASLSLMVDELIDQRSATALVINVTDQAASQRQIPAALVTLPSLAEADAVRTRIFTLEGRGNMGNPVLTINNQAMDLAVVNETLRLDEVEIWEIINTMNVPHNFHIHATHFQVLDRNGSPAQVADNEKGYKDTVYVPPGESVRFLVKMTDYADPNGKYMYHCHFLEHEDAGMMGQFVVTS